MSRPPDPKEPVEGKQPGLHTVSKDKLKALLEKHRTWLHSDGGNGGKRADLQQANLRGVDLQGADLRRALFQGSNLEGANLRSVKLQGAQLASANLARVDLSGAELSGADLSNTDLEDVKGLSANQLAGANLTNAKLPEAIRQFESLKTITEASKLARPILLLILSAAVYAFLTAVLTDDKALILNLSSQLIPQLQTPIPTAFFYRLAPFVILSLYVYFLLYLHWIWTNVSTLPAVFPDGTTLDKRIYPWLLNRLVAISSRRADYSLSHYSLSEFVSIFLAWWVAPITLGILWFRYLPMHDWTWTLMHVAFFSAAVGIGKASQQRTVVTLRGELLKARALPLSEKSPVWRRAARAIRSHRAVTWTVAATVVTLVISLRAIEGSPAPDYYNFGFRSLYYRLQMSFFADLSGLSETDLTKGNLKNLKNARLNGAGLAEAKLPAGLELGSINLREAKLDRADFNGARFITANLAKASLVDAQLQGADFNNGCHLEGANLSGAHLQNATLLGTDLQGADFGGANLQDAKLIGSDLKGAQFIGADLQRADLTSCDLKGAEFSKAQLQGADLSRAYLQKATVLDTNFQGPDFKDANLQDAKLIDSDLRGAQFNGAQLIAAELQGADLSSSELKGAQFIGADLQRADLSGCHLEGADLRGANLHDVKGLTQGQLDKAFGDANTKLPPGLTIRLYTEGMFPW